MSYELQVYQEHTLQEHSASLIEDIQIPKALIRVLWEHAYIMCAWGVLNASDERSDRQTWFISHPWRVQGIPIDVEVRAARLDSAFSVVVAFRLSTLVFEHRIKQTQGRCNCHEIGLWNLECLREIQISASFYVVYQDYNMVLWQFRSEAWMLLRSNCRSIRFITV